MSDTKTPKIEFPCPDYPIKVMGEKSADYQEVVLGIMQVHAPGYDVEKITIRDSRNGNYLAITVYIEATGEEQLKAIFEDLKSHPSTRMVL